MSAAIHGSTGLARAGQPSMQQVAVIGSTFMVNMESCS